MQLQDDAYDRILESVRSGEFLPGSLITEGQLSAKLGFGKAPIRTALTRLVQDGWLEPMSRRGHRVKPLTIADVRDLFLTRKLVEPFATRLAAKRIDPSSRAVLEAACDQDHERWAGMDREAAFFAANKCFHVAIAEASGSTRLAGIIATLHDEAERVLRYASKTHGLTHLTTFDGWTHGHLEILGALSASDADRAERLALQQLEHSEQTVIEALQMKVEALQL